MLSIAIVEGYREKCVTVVTVVTPKKSGNILSKNADSKMLAVRGSKYLI